MGDEQTRIGRDLVDAHKLAEESGEEYHTIDFWTGRRLLIVSQRRGKERFYRKEESLKRIKRIRELQSQEPPCSIAQIEGILKEEFKGE